VSLELLQPDWPAPARVRAFSTVRGGGVSAPPYAGLNLGDHVGDDPAAVSANRQILRRHLPGEPLWLRQVHGVAVVELGQAHGGAPPEADAAVARQAGRVCAVLTADCLPVLFCDLGGTVVAAAHAGWRGLLAGVLEHTVAALGVAPREVLAWLGPAIGPDAFEVGDEVRQAFVAGWADAAAAFRPGVLAGKWWADLPALARQRLSRAGVEAVFGGELCTHGDGRRFFSFRRDGVTGRQGSFIWLA
jgi:hypothetical protein